MNDRVHLIGGKAYKEARVVMLSTQKSKLVKFLREVPYYFGSNNFYQSGSLHYLSAHQKTSNSIECQEIYIVSNEEVRQEDIDTTVCMFYPWGHSDNSACLAGKGIGRIRTAGKYYKVIACTDSSYLLPRPSDDFIQRYCDFGGIDKVLVEYTLNESSPGIKWSASPNDNWIQSAPDTYSLKVAPDGTITIRPVEKLTFKDKFDQFIDERIENASTLSSEAAYQIVKQFVNEQWKQNG